jgi:chromosomal replication initiation ATPase DnaA
MVKDLRALNNYPYCGHRCLVGKRTHDWQDVDYLLRLFASNRPEAIRRYREFVKSVLAQAKEDFEGKHQLPSEGIRFEHVVHRVAGVLDLTPAQVLAVGKHKETVAARSLLCFWAATELAISQVELAQKLKISQPAVSMAVRRGEQLASHNSYSYSLKD